MARLLEVATLDVVPTQPFAFDATFHKPDHFPSQDTAWEPGVRWQTLRLGDQSVGLRIEDATPNVRVHVWARGRVSGQLLGTVAEELPWRANLRLDLADFEHHAMPAATRRSHPSFAAGGACARCTSGRSMSTW